MNSSTDDWHLYCLSVSLRGAGLKRPTRHRALVPPHHLKSWLIECGLVVPSNNNTIDFALRSQAMTSKMPSFVWSTKLKITLQAHLLICCSVEWTGPGGQEMIRVHWKSLASFFSALTWFLAANGDLFLGGDKGPLLYFGFLVARLLSPRSPITQFDLTLPVQGEPWPGATHCYTSRNTMKSNITLSTHTVTLARMHMNTSDCTLLIQFFFKRLCWEIQDQ